MPLFYISVEVCWKGLTTKTFTEGGLVGIFYWINLAADWAARPFHSIWPGDHKDPFASVKYVNFLLDWAGIKLLLNITLECKDPLALVKYSWTFLMIHWLNYPLEILSIWGSWILMYHQDPQILAWLENLHCCPVRLAGDRFVPKLSVCCIIGRLPILNSHHLRIT